MRFNHVFFALMLLSFISAFVAPQRWTDAGRVQLEGLFIPVSRPAYYLATRLRRHFAPEAADDVRPRDQVSEENLKLRQEVTRLQMEVERLSGLAAERQSLGDLQSLCDHYTVAGTDSGGRDGLILAGTIPGARQDQPVLYNGGLAGRIDRAGAGAVHVRLITDSGFVVTGRFIRFSKSDTGVVAQRVSQLEPIVEGAGGGQMTITKLSLQEVTAAGIQPEDWVVLSDNNWPAAVQGIRLGKVASIARYRKAPLFAEIRLAPESGLMRLNDVWVMTRDGN